MDITVLDKTLTPIAIIDDYVSFIWTERYDECGDFELVMAMDPQLLDIFQMDYLLTIKESDKAMIIEEIDVDSNIEDGDRLTITGRSLESILDRRVFDHLITYEDMPLQYPNIADGMVASMIGHNICHTYRNYTVDSHRVISNLSYVMTTDSRITSLTGSGQYQGTNLYNAISDLCKDAKIGFKIVLDGTDFKMSLYMGEDRSYDQTTNDYVVFSPEFDNIVSSNYVNSQKTYANYAYVGGEGEGNDKVVVSAYFADGRVVPSGFSRKEVFINASGISSKKEDGTTMSASAYKALLTNQGKMELAGNYKMKTGFDGEVDATRLFVYGRDFFLGDIVQVADAYGNSGTCYISEMIISDDENGYAIYPTFKNAEEEE